MTHWLLYVIYLPLNNTPTKARKGEALDEKAHVYNIISEGREMVIDHGVLSKIHSWCQHSLNVALPKSLCGTLKQGFSASVLAVKIIDGNNIEIECFEWRDMTFLHVRLL